MRKITRAEMPVIRNELYKKQNGRCPLTDRPLPSITSGNLVLDHDHVTGSIRSIMSKAPNGGEGKINNVLIRWFSCKSVSDKVSVLRNLANYYELHETDQHGLIYHLHKSPHEALDAKNKKARLAYKRKVAKLKKGS